MHTICTVHMCMYLTPIYKQYIHAVFDTYRYAHAGSLMLGAPGARPPSIRPRAGRAQARGLGSPRHQVLREREREREGWREGGREEEQSEGGREKGREERRQRGTEREGG
jgi:hypothetical protein